MKLAQYWIARGVLATPALAPLYGRLLDLAVPRLRRIALRNLELAGYGEGDRMRIADGVFRSIGRLIGAFARFPKMSPQTLARWIRYEGLEHFTAAASRKRGVLIATGHLGNWELSAFAHAWMSGPMNIVVRPLDNPKIDALVARRRTLSGNRILSKREAAREIFRALERGEAVGILVDQNTSPEEGVFIDFFGTKACAGTAFVKFAHRTGAAVVPGFALWEEKERRHVLRFYPEIEMTGDVLADTQRVHRFLEGVIREYPDQWLWIHRRWKTRPAGEPGLY
ncbi:MAG TPA: lysophospholipid acyltransferase family protein [Bryobacteraceae bacterium]|nr:lysophospholipid acyltransferase family protein [Bryobacteraceae bacterium]